MQHIRYIINIAACIMLLQIIGCKQDDVSEPTEMELRIAKLAKQWQLAEGVSVTLNSEDVSSVFQDFALMFDEQQNFTSSHGSGPVWPETGAYTFEMVDGTPNLNRIIRSDGAIINIAELTENSLRVEFFYDASLSNGRTLGISGDYSFHLIAP